MEVSTIRQQLHELIDRMDDEKLKAIYTLLEENQDTKEAQRKKLIESERERYLNGAGSSFSPEEVRNMALNKTARNGLQD
jgi:hypothetical protein